MFLMSTRVLVEPALEVRNIDEHGSVSMRGKNMRGRLVAFIRKLHGPMMCSGYSLTRRPLVLVQPGTGKRPVDWCKNSMSAQYLQKQMLLMGYDHFSVFTDF